MLESCRTFSLYPSGGGGWRLLRSSLGEARGDEPHLLGSKPSTSESDAHSRVGSNPSPRLALRTRAELPLLLNGQFDSGLERIEHPGRQPQAARLLPTVNRRA